MTSIIEIGHSKGHYPVVIEDGLLDRLGERLAPYVQQGRVFILTDPHVCDHLGPRFAASCGDAAIYISSSLHFGEDYKSWDHFKEVLDLFIKWGIERNDTVVAVGGGTVGDMVGFAAAAFKRGCNWVHVPTTVVAMVDSSVGGKTGINYGGFKNNLGAFHPPVAVLIDPTALDTLPGHHVISGYAEVIKYATINDEPFFTWLEQRSELFFKGDWKAREEVIRRSILHKGVIVADDEFDRGQRMLLNFGHTFGHAIEKLSHFTVPHGEAVAVGMTMAIRLSVAKGLCPVDDMARFHAMLDSVWLPTDVEQLSIEFTGQQLADAMAGDKKSTGGQVPLILCRRIGECFVDRSTDLGEVASLYDAGQL